MEQAESCKRGRRGGNWLKEAEGISQRTCMNVDMDKGVGITYGTGGGQSEQREENWDNCNSTNSKMFEK